MVDNSVRCPNGVGFYFLETLANVVSVYVENKKLYQNKIEFINYGLTVLNSLLQGCNRILNGSPLIVYVIKSIIQIKNCVSVLFVYHLYAILVLFNVTIGFTYH